MGTLQRSLSNFWPGVKLDIGIFKTSHLLTRSMDLGPKLESLLEVRYVPEVDEAARRSLKRSEKFVVQVKSAVGKMQVFFKSFSLARIFISSLHRTSTP